MTRLEHITEKDPSPFPCLESYLVLVFFFVCLINNGSSDEANNASS